MPGQEAGAGVRTFSPMALNPPSASAKAVGCEHAERNEDNLRGKAPYSRSDEGDEDAKKLRGAGRGRWGVCGQRSRVAGRVE
tara:strand:- start:13822 stop:14067 length:246 start_codon:yes stop_codon:yes gene_type:complete